MAEVRETAAWGIYQSTQRAYKAANLDAVLREARDFYDGAQYRGLKPGQMAPQLNYIWEAVERVQAKLVGTPCRMEFVSDRPQGDLDKLDDYYEYLTTDIGDELIDSEVAHAGLIDGTAVCFTSWDEDTIGSRGLAKGHLKRMVVPIESCFFDDLYIEDVQDEKSVGYACRMQIDAVRKLLADECADYLSEKEIEERQRYIVPDDWFRNSEVRPELDNSEVQGTDYCTVLTRFFRIEGEVVFEMSTQYVALFPFPHALSMDVNRSIVERAEDTQKEWQISVRRDYEGIDQTRYTLFTPPREQSEREYRKERRKFSRYPVSVFRPYPRTGTILGDSYVSKLVPTQRTINYLNLLVTLILQSHGAPKWIAKRGALRGQVIDDSPNQVIEDSSPAGVVGVSRINPSTAVPADIMNIAYSFGQQTERVFGFGDLTANASADTSGYAYQQQVQQQNLVLEIPQKRLWKYKTETARTDLMYLRHYVAEDFYYRRRDDAEVQMQSNYKVMAMNLDPSLAQMSEMGDIRPVTKETVDSGLFDSDFDVIPNPVQGVGQSAISQSQHINSMFQTFMQGNVKAEDLKALVMSDPSIDHKTRRTILTALESVETSQLAQLRAENQQLQSYLQQVVQSYQQLRSQVEQVSKRASAQEKAYREQTQAQGQYADYMARALQRLRTQSGESGPVASSTAAVSERTATATPTSYVGASDGGVATEGEVKSKNARGMSGSVFETS